MSIIENLENEISRKLLICYAYLQIGDLNLTGAKIDSFRSAVWFRSAILTLTLPDNCWQIYMYGVFFSGEASIISHDQVRYCSSFSSWCEVDYVSNGNDDQVFSQFPRWCWRWVLRNKQQSSLSSS